MLYYKVTNTKEDSSKRIAKKYDKWRTNGKTEKVSPFFISNYYILNRLNSQLKAEIRRMDIKSWSKYMLSRKTHFRFKPQICWKYMDGKRFSMQIVNQKKGWSGY